MKERDDFIFEESDSSGVPQNRLGKGIMLHTSDLSLAAFQRHISEKYERVDRERGSDKTFLWFIEEVGELATALNGENRANLQEEFADVLAWLCTLANINDVDLTAAVTGKYLSNLPPQGHK